MKPTGEKNSKVSAEEGKFLNARRRRRRKRKGKLSRERRALYVVRESAVSFTRKILGVVKGGGGGGVRLASL